MAMRPSSRMARKLRKPLPGSPSRFSTGTRQSSRVMPWVSLACQPILRYGGSMMRPGVPAGTTKAEIWSSSVRAVTVTIDVSSVPELVMNAFDPLSTHSPVDSSSRARVRVAPASLPPSGSVRPKAPRARPATRSGSHRCCWSSSPNWKIGLVPRPTAADRVMPTDWSTRPISSMARHSVVKSAPLPPHCSGNTRPNSPRSAMARTTSIGKTWSRSHCSAWGAISARAKSRTTSRNASCSSERSKSIGRHSIGTRERQLHHQPQVGRAGHHQLLVLEDQVAVHRVAEPPQPAS